MYYSFYTFDFTVYAFNFDLTLTVYALSVYAFDLTLSVYALI